MTDRRDFLVQGLAATGVAAFAATAGAGEPREPAAGVGGYEYRLPAFEPGSRLLFQGDSITDMKWGRNERDRNHYLGHSYVYLIAARLGVDLPAARLDIYNRGISGHTVGDLRQRWQKDAIDMRPDLLSILIGTNDVGKGVQPAAFEEDYRHLLEASRRANPKLKLVLLDPFVLPSGGLSNADAYEKRRTAIDRFIAVVRTLAKDFEAVHVSTQEVFDEAAQVAPPEHWIWDGVHPLPQGHELIARHWVRAVATRWGAVA